MHRDLWIIFILHIGAFFLFTNGFFLTRYESTQVSSCTNKSMIHSNLRQVKRYDDGCWSKKKFQRVVYVVIDALRFDFMQKATEKERNEKEIDGGKYFLNHLPHIHQVLEKEPGNSLLFRFIADAPTMTMQRLKGLTTGSLPTFLDIKDNMNSEEIVEDSWIKQLGALNKSIVFMGDDTWDKLYPNAFLRNYSYDSFNVKDLHTVDNGILTHFFPELEEKDDWDLLIAHFLGVDHVGHTFGPNHPSMEAKLHEMNRFLENLTRRLPTDTLAVVLGDHGMSSDGNHGGASDEETGAALFLYSKQPLHQLNEKNQSLYEIQSNKVYTSIAQVDLVPSISLLMGLPIPFGNLGAIIPHLFFFPSHYNGTDAWNQLNIALLVNVHQLRNYFHTTQTIRMDLPAMIELEELYASILDSSIDLKSQHLLLQKYLQDALTLSRSLYTQFDLVSMTYGILLLFLSSLLLFFGSCFTIQRILLSLGMGITLASIWSCFPLNWLWFLPGAFLPRCIALCGLFLGMLSCRWSLAYCSIDILSGMLLILHLASLFSNSYLIIQDKLLHFLSASSLLFHGLATFANPSHRTSRSIMSFVLLCVVHRLYTSWPTPNIVYTSISIELTILPMCLLGLYVGFTHPPSLLSYICVWFHWFDIYPLYTPWFVYLWCLVHGMALIPFLLTLTLLLGPTSPGTFVLFLLVIELRKRTLPFPPWSYCFLIHSLYFQTGHGNSFTSLQNGAGFVGMEDFQWHVAGLLLAINTFGSFWFALNFTSPRDMRIVLQYFNLSALCTTIFVAIQRRHLMVWAIFAPKYVFDGIILIVVNGLLAIRASWTREKVY